MTLKSLINAPDLNEATHDAGDRLRASQVAALFDNVVIGVSGAAGGAVVLAFSLVQLGPLRIRTAVLWVGFIVVCAAFHIGLRNVYRRRGGERADWRVFAAAFTVISLAEGTGWGWASVSLVGDARLDLQLLVFVVCFGIAAGAVPAFGSFLPAFLCLFLPATIPELIWSLRAAESPQQALFAMLAGVFVLAMGGLGLRANTSFRVIVGLRLRADDLAADLRRQKDRADEANLAKSTFLAAASHDLRQPVHALSLFVGALRNVTLPPDALHLVEQIEASTQALDDLFGALLDISRLDAGIVEAQPSVFPISGMLDRICGDHAGEAATKALSLTAVRCSAVVLTDPVLLERILRNLVVNAIRHTAKGRVLVGCRRRRNSVWIEVWDTGRGIAPEHQSRIFLEYVQLGNPERDRVKGLGLGLAIVRRLCALLDCAIEVRSVPGHGSCFRVAVPLTSRRPAAPATPASDAAPVPGKGLIVVVDDEPAIREGMSRLLGGWGYGTIVAGSRDELMMSLAACPEMPALVICDYRLRDGDTGSALIEALRSEYNESIPAVLITGDTAPDRLAEARASGFLLLHKPVPNGRLRAAIGNLIAAAQAERSAATDEPSTLR